MPAPDPDQAGPGPDEGGDVTAESPETAGRAGIGRARQNAVYRDGVLGRRPRVPVDAEALEAAARRRMSPRARAYVDGGAGTGATMRHNREAFDRWRVVPRMLHGTTRRDLSHAGARAPTCRRRCCWPRSGRASWSAPTATC